MGLIGVGGLSPLQARIRLALALGAGLKGKELSEYMQDALEPLIVLPPFGDCEEFDRPIRESRFVHVLGGDPRDALDFDVLDPDFCVECERGEDRAFSCGVEAFDVGTRIRFGEAEFLSLLEGRLVAEIAGRHGVEDEVRRAVHDPYDSRDAVPGKGSFYTESLFLLLLFLTWLAYKNKAYRWSGFWGMLLTASRVVGVVAVTVLVLTYLYRAYKAQQLFTRQTQIGRAHV